MRDRVYDRIPAIVRRSYALKFGLILLVLGVSIGTLGMVATGALTESVESTVLEDQQDAAVQEAQAVDNWDERNRQLVATATGAPALQSDDEEVRQEYLQDVYQDLPDERVNALYVDTATGEVLDGVDTDAETLEGIAFPETDALDEASIHQTQRTDPYAMPDEHRVTFDDRPVVSYYIGVGDDADRALVVTFTLADRSTDLLSSTDSDTVVTILDEEDRIVGDDAYLGYQEDRDAVSFLETYDDADGILETARADAPGATKVDGAPSETLHDEPYGFAPDGYVVGYHTTADGWLVLVHTAESDALGFVETVDQFGTGITILGVVLIGLFGAVIGRSTAVSIDRLTDKVGKMEDGDLDVEFETRRIDNIGRLYDGFGSMRDELNLQITEAEDARADAERERERVQRLNEDLERAATTYCGVMAEAARGNLTVRMDPNTSDNETMEEIAVDFNEMLAEIESTIEDLNRFATEVATASEQVTASSEEVRSASQQVSESVQEISDGADQQYESLRSVDAEMNALSTTTEEIAASSNEVADVAERTAHTGREGHDAARDAVDACEQLEHERDAVVDEFDQLRAEVAEVDELIDRIAEIAEQTNMLALNANIEASRSAAGDDGGFAAVAAEVKELSQNVKTATEEIDHRLEGIKSQTERSAEEIDRTSDEIERVNDLVTNAVGALEEISEYAEETNDGVQSISAATEEQAASTQEVVAMVDEVATISEETTAEAENVAAAAEEQTSALTEVSRSADDLSQQAVTLSEALDRFETDAESETARESDIDPAALATVGDDGDGRRGIDSGDEIIGTNDETDAGTTATDEETADGETTESDGETADGETTESEGETADDETFSFGG
ncbi:methyl-accepting chemotaxis protein [Natronorubrum tibetense]|uniref:Methyl-accepting chemotaxis sensory transducer n=1 Tax=Natronorubrum tibetense GA33 TaxID=1114856 RepID=L9VS17_9EURY|nr:methyl-accepting chemotaxis protein [Natronorubrum tibetense]ELY39787.1 methyl-accepting chemotaxis sensory transducer [Natronorubrum tibetense GA33]